MAYSDMEVKPDNPDAKVKFLAAEALRGVGGLINSGSLKMANHSR